jgi:hypothetical protein
LFGSPHSALEAQDAEVDNNLQVLLHHVPSSQEGTLIVGGVPRQVNPEPAKNWYNPMI